MPLPATFGNTSSSPFGFISILRTVSLGTTWTLIDVRDEAFSGEADVNAQLVAMGFVAADLQARGILRSISVINLHATQSAYVTEAEVPTTSTTLPANAYGTVPAGAALLRAHHPRRELTKTRLRGSGADTTISYELTIDLPPAE